MLADSRNTPSGLTRARLVMDVLVGSVQQRRFAVRYWDGTTDAPASVEALPFTLVIKSPGALRRLCCAPSELRLGEAFVRGDLDVDGDLEEATTLAEDIAVRLASPRALATLVRRALALPDSDGEMPAGAEARARDRRGRRHSRARDHAAIRFHYDVGNEFYAVWLDRAMIYSCAYFETGDETIDEAQRAKLDHICRKLRLQPGERLLDIGCGWGALVRHAARCYGVSATGVTLSARQAAWARERIAAEGLGEVCAVEVMDYRDVPAREFDKIVSVGMVEHVGRSRLGTYFRQAYALLAPGGLFLNHGIIALTAAAPRRLAGWVRRTVWREGAFLDRYVFPDGEILPLDDMVRQAERAGFETRDVESLREHYVLTLRAWVHRLTERQREAIRVVGAEAYRTWRLYMMASAHAFATGRIGLAQTLFAKPDHAGHTRLPLTRADLY
ncbi:MAG TPA: cyclopropane-fatty-acyl-phospholipid synthase family protein [Gemmatimonadaceae bacterium]|nr:cyclopropane-fatty-acyl-phospholipid synthase family protein [Gemmatimonadaceae bacterium]